MKMVVGLGNPGRRYAGTRHNVGFQVVAEVARRHGAGAARQRFQGELAEVRIGEQTVQLLCPLTYMNASGGSVQPARDFFRIADADLLVVCDDFNLPLARLRMRPRGSAGGQKGLEDVLRRLGTEDIARLRIGIGPVPEQWDVTNFVLGKFTPQQRQEIDPALDRAAQAVADWVRHDIQYCMNQYNSSSNSP
jgi:PTH1 family peptidyl-tRNA hydrolase